MKKVLKGAVTLMVICFIICAGFAVLSAQAAEDGTTAANAINLNEGVYHTKKWTYSNYKLGCYNKIVIGEKGLMTFSMFKPFSDAGEIESLDFVLYNTDGEVVWAADTYDQIESFNDSFVYRIGLTSGTYYMYLDPFFYIAKDSDGMETRYKFDFEACDNWETENNNTLADATKIKVGKLYNGVYGEESFDYTYADCYAVSLSKGAAYVINFENFSQMSEADFGLYDAKGNEIQLPEAKIEGKTAKWDIAVKESGTYYLVLDNYGNESGISYKIGVFVAKEQEFAFDKAVSGIKATQTASSVTLSWNKLSQATGYRVYQYSSSKKKYVQVASVKTNTFKKTGLKAGTTYKFKIRAYKKLSDGTVIWAEDSAVFTTATKCKAPKLTVAKNYTNSPKVKLEWNEVTGATGYQVYYATSKNGTYKKIALKNADDDSVVKAFSSSASGKKIYFKVRAYKKVSGKIIYGDFSALKSAVLH
ncbi:MAG: fibronectin type III domain-containing protein [Clostridia bacterium]|nr:fibronectin type III domain-containing protein [Clostridia bacterium]